jgi:hypothetical protein
MTSEDTTDTYRFAQLEGDDDAASVNLADDPRIAFLACRVADQQRAGFGSYLDLRQVPCPDCGGPGFNTGWGVWAFVCGAEFHTDGEPCEPCAAGQSLNGLAQDGDHD